MEMISVMISPLTATLKRVSEKSSVTARSTPSWRTTRTENPSTDASCSAYDKHSPRAHVLLLDHDLRHPVGAEVGEGVNRVLEETRLLARFAR